VDPETGDLLYASNLELPDVAAPAYPWPRCVPRFGFLPPGLWLGAAGCVSALHNDASDNLHLMVSGKKQFTLFPPHVVEYVYSWQLKYAPNRPTQSDVDPEKPDREAFPLFSKAEAQCVRCVIESGELLFLPARWFHHVRCLETSVSTNVWLSGLIPYAATGGGSEIPIEAYLQVLQKHCEDGDLSRADFDALTADVDELERARKGGSLGYDQYYQRVSALHVNAARKVVSNVKARSLGTKLPRIPVPIFTPRG
jgi:hypothetical protein